MALLAMLLVASERVYRWLVKIYPRSFRAEHENEMVQNFRDLCREQLDQSRPMRMMGFWGHTFLDLTASAAMEHLRRRKPMAALDRDLRWDMRYGVQMFWKHFLWLLKYTALALIGGAVAIVLAAWIWSGVRIWQKEKPVNAAWEGLTGKAPEAYFQSTLQQFPKTGMNQTARQLEKLTAKLGIYNPMPNRLYDGQRKNFVGPFDTIDAPIYVLSQLRTPTDETYEAPTRLQDYLKNHRADLDALYNLVLRSEVPSWESDATLLMRAPVPGLFYHRQLQGLIALDILEKTRRGETSAALESLEASWKINQSLRDRPELISQLCALSILDLQLGLMRKMRGVPLDWQQNLETKPWQQALLRSLEFEAIVTYKSLLESKNRPSLRWLNPLWSPLGEPVRYLGGIEMLEVSELAFNTMRTTSFCESSPDNAIDESMSRFRPTWSFDVLSGAINYPRAWKRLIQAMIHLELTRKTLEVKFAPGSTGMRERASQSGSTPSIICPRATWVHEKRVDGTVRIYCNRLPEWIEKEHRVQDLALEYILKAQR